MSDNMSQPNIDELDQIVEELIQRSGYQEEWYFAIKSGWDDLEFETLYSEYVKSTQVILKPGDDATALKGKPLENIMHYFLKQGGVVTDITEINDHQRWQVDGQGPLSSISINRCFTKYCQHFGIHLYMEAKNHKDPIENNDFALHSERMELHDCQFGVCVSTTGFRIAKGKGIAQAIFYSFLKSKKYHLLLAFHSIYNVIFKDMAPLAILKNALSYATNDKFTNDSAIQEIYSKRYNQDLAISEHKRLFAN